MLKGSIRLTIEDDGNFHETILKERDLASVPPGYYRGLYNTGQEEALMLVMLGNKKPVTPHYPPDHPLTKIKWPKKIEWPGVGQVTNKAYWVDDAYPSRRMDVDGRTQAYREAGDWETPLMMLLHGIGSGSGSWGYLMDHFKDRYRLIAWDAPGYNISTPLPEDKPGALGYARALGRFLDTIGVRPAVMIGHSLGAMVAGAYAAEVNPDVPALILGDPANGYGEAAPEIRDRNFNTGWKWCVTWGLRVWLKCTIWKPAFRYTALRSCRDG